MPVVNFHLVEGQYTAEQAKELLQQAVADYCDVLKSPMNRVRAFITPHRANEFFVHGDLVSHNGVHAPYFEFIVLDGRPLDERQALMLRFSMLLARVLDVELSAVRGHCRRVLAEEWAIGGSPASDLRSSEIAARKAKAES